jgi:hypothetical protein
LSLLKQTVSGKDGYDVDAFLLSETQAGYRITFAGCEAEPNGVVQRYQIVTVPVEPGKSGVRAFCSDETGALWFDADGSAEK